MGRFTATSLGGEELERSSTLVHQKLGPSAGFASEAAYRRVSSRGVWWL